MTKNKTWLKRIAISVLAIMMAFLFCVPSFIFAVPNGTEKGNFTISNVDDNATSVEAYRIVEPKLQNGKMTGYQAINDVVKAAFTDVNGKIDYTKAPSPEKLATITSEQIKNVAPVAFNKGTEAGKWSSSQLPSGIYLIKIETNGTVVYNPIIIGVSYGDKDQIKADQKFEINKDAYAKKEEPKLTKEIVEPGNTGNTKGNDIAIGDDVKFKVSATVASYSKAYKDIELNISDELSKGLTLNKDSIEVKIGQKGVDSNVLNITKKDDGFSVIITDRDWILEHGSAKIDVTYSAKLNTEATSNFVANSNKVTYTYSNNPYNKDSKGKDEDKTYRYTFEIDGLVNGQGSETSHEFIKTGEGIKKIQHEFIKNNGELAGAKFQLYTDPECNKPVENSEKVTTEKGYFNFKGLDAKKKYYLKEVDAPAPYMVSEKIVTIEVDATYNTDGTLATYQFIVDGKPMQKFTAKYENEKPTVTVDPNTKDNHFEFKNTKTPELPSTGGMGTYIFTILGATIIALAIGIFIKRKKAERR